MSRTLALFDFDKTLVARDSFRLFGQMAAGSRWQRVRLLGEALVYKTGVTTNGDYKARVLRAVWAGKTEAAREAHLRRFREVLRRCERPNVVKALRDHLRVGDAVAILSASPRFYLAPFVRERWSKKIDVHGSDVRVEGRGVTVDALYGEKKRALAQRLLRERAPEVVWAYTDHLSDLPLLQLADRRRLVAPSRALRRAMRERGLDYEVIPTRA
jgi:HAD superfamily phosphoserine phosphatase-like hydrolase